MVNSVFVESMVADIGLFDSTISTSFFRQIVDECFWKIQADGQGRTTKEKLQLDLICLVKQEIGRIVLGGDGQPRTYKSTFGEAAVPSYLEAHKFINKLQIIATTKIK